MADAVGPRYDVFISYAEADRAWVDGFLIDGLERAGVRCHREAAFALGVPRVQEFETAIKSSNRTLLVLSPAYFAGETASFVDLLAMTYGMETKTWPVIPLRLERVDLPTRLSMLTSLDATDPDEREQVLEKLCDLFQRPVPAAAGPPECPYPGMRPFTLDDTSSFFGRDDECDQLLDALRRSRFLTVIGCSGSGKSSLVFAGLVPRLRQTTLRELRGKWRILTMRPGDQPLADLAKVLGADPADPSAAVSHALKAEPEATRVLLVVDQFEEVFSADQQEARRFLQSLQSLQKAESLTITLTVRADFYAELMGTLLWPLIKANRFDVVPLDEAGLKEAIARPAEKVGVFVESALVQRLVADALEAQSPGIMPLVQEALVQLWEKLERRVLPLHAYESFVLPRPAHDRQQDGQQRNGLEVAIARHADWTLNQLEIEDPGRVEIARRIFLRMVQFGEGRPDTRRRQEVAQLCAGRDSASYQETLSALVKSRLITLSGESETGQRRADIAHEALIRGWPALQRSIKESRKAEEVRRKLERKAQEWIDAGRGTEGLLGTGGLAEAESWVASPDAGDLREDDPIRRLIHDSRAAITNELERAQQREAQARQMTADVLIASGATEIGEGSNTAALMLFARALSYQDENSQPQAFSRQRVGFIAWQIPRLRAILEHDGPVISAMFSPSGAQILSASQENVARVWDGNSGKAIARLEGHTDWINTVDFSPDGSRVVSASKDGTARVWVANSGQVITELKGHTAPLNFAAFSPDGNRIVTASSDRSARVWDATSGKLIVVLEGHTGAVRSAVFSRDGRHILTASDDHTARVWDATSGQLVHELKGHTSEVNWAVFSPDDALAITASLDSTGRLWDLKSGESIAELKGHEGPVVLAAFSPDGGRIVTASNDATARVWEAAPGRSLTVLRGHSGLVMSASFSQHPDGMRVVTASADFTARIWDPESGKSLLDAAGHRSMVTSASLSHDGTRMVTASTDRAVRIWEIRPHASIAEIAGHRHAVTYAAFSPDGGRLVTASADHTARIWDAKRRETLRELNAEAPVNHAAFSPEGNRVVTASDDHTARVWDAASGKVIAVLKGHIGAVRSAVFSPDGNRVVTASDDHTARVWDATSGQSIHILRAHAREVYTAAFSRQDGSRIVTASMDGTTRLWDTATGQEDLPKLGDSLLPVITGAFSPDGKSILTAGYSGRARLWDVVTRERRVSFTGHKGVIFTAEFSPDGHRVVTACADRTARVWDASNGQLIAELKGHTARVFSATFGPDGHVILTASEDKTARIWSLDPMPGDPENILLWAEVLTGSKLGGEGGLTATEWHERRRRLKALGDKSPPAPWLTDVEP